MHIILLLFILAFLVSIVVPIIIIRIIWFLFMETKESLGIGEAPDVGDNLEHDLDCVEFNGTGLNIEDKKND